MESAPCVTWGLGAWSSVVSTKQSYHLPVFVYPLCTLWNKLVKSLCSQWTISVMCHWSCCRVTLRNPWMITPSAGWSSYLSSGTQLYMETPQGWTGEERQDPTSFESFGIINQTEQRSILSSLVIPIMSGTFAWRYISLAKCTKWVLSLLFSWVGFVNNCYLDCNGNLLDCLYNHWNTVCGNVSYLVVWLTD